jgi:hypothetical protein
MGVRPLFRCALRRAADGAAGHLTLSYCGNSAHAAILARMRTFRLLLAVSALALSACATMPLYPPRPPNGAPQAFVEPAPSKIVVHVAVTQDGLGRALDEVLPKGGSGTFSLQGQRAWTWQRTPIFFKLADGKVHGLATVMLGAELPVLGTQSLKFDLKLSGEPVVSSDYKVRLQSPKVELVAQNVSVRIADMIGGTLSQLRTELVGTIEGYAYDLSPKILEAYARFAAPMELPLGDARGCFALKVTGVEAGPTVLAGGVEKDLALIVAPSVTLPCNPPPMPASPAPLANVAALPTGPFTVTVPVAASYEELAKAMTLAFTDGKLFFSKEHTELYLTNPEIYSSQNQLVVKVHLAGAITRPISLTLDGDIFFAGHPAVIDNELQIPDLVPTVETGSFLLALKAKLDGESIRDSARQALRLDLGERLTSARAKVTGDFPLGIGCARSDVSKIEVTGVYPHAGYLRIYVAVTAQAAIYIPCPNPPAEAPDPAAEARK